MKNGKSIDGGADMHIHHNIRPKGLNKPITEVRTQKESNSFVKPRIAVKLFGLYRYPNRATLSPTISSQSSLNLSYR